MSAAPNIETAKEAARRLAARQIRDGYVPDGLHVYTDVDGRELYHRIRVKHPVTGDKWMRPMHRNGAGYELGEPALPNGKKPLYRLVELAKADPSRPVWFVEGEKCADALEKLGQVATTAGGATSDESADFEPLRGRNIILWPDNDQPGRDHMRRVAAKIRALGCTVETVDIDRLALPDKGDVVDYLGAQPEATAADLAVLARVGEDTGPESHSDEQVELIRGDAIRLEAVRWLWSGWLARGKLHILAGAPGTGKTTIALAIAATITSGGRWPDGSRADVGSVLIWSGEDDPRDTLAPRLLAMGANMKRVHFVGSVAAGEGRRPFDPAMDMRALMTRAAEIRDVRLLIVDPIVNAVAVDSHKNGEVRRALAPIVDLASGLDCAALGISHFTKGTAGRDPVERVTGSLAFGALPRVVLAAARIKEDDGSERRLLARAKSNIGPDGGGFSYVLEQVSVRDHPGISASRVMWGAPIDGTARELLADAEAVEEAGTEARDAAEWLWETLESGPMTAKEVERVAAQAGFAWRTVQRAMKRAGVKSVREGFGKNARYVWKRAMRATESPCAPDTEFGANGAHGGAGGDSRDEEVF